MEKLISSRSHLQVVPESYILPPETTPGNTQVSVLETIPVIDFQQLGTDRPQLIKKIIDTAQEFGFFQVWHAFFFLSFVSSRFHGIVFKYIFHTMQLINHGVPENLSHSVYCVLDVANEVFDRAAFYRQSKLLHVPKTLSKVVNYTPATTIWEGRRITGEKN